MPSLCARLSACFALSDAGAFTCLGYPGSRGNEKVDAATFAGFGVDFLKYDNCWAPASDWIVERYEAMRDALNETGQPILFSMYALKAPLYVTMAAVLRFNG